MRNKEDKKTYEPFFKHRKRLVIDIMDELDRKEFFVNQKEVVIGTEFIATAFRECPDHHCWNEVVISLNTPDLEKAIEKLREFAKEK